MTTTLATSLDAKPAIGVAEITVFAVHIPLKKTIRHASHTRKESDNLVVRCTLEDGTIGYGEGVPRHYVTGETLATSLELLQATAWAGQLHRVEQFAAAVEMLEAFTLAPMPGDERHCVGNAARCAMELALLDAFGRYFGVCLTRLPEFLPETKAIYEHRSSCRYSGAITSKSPFREVLSALKMRVGGFKDCKIKVGTAGQDDVARLRRFRRLLGPRVDLRIDANDAWTPANAVAKIQELEPFGITAVEQPVPHADVNCLAAVRQQVKTPIMLDESLCSWHDGQVAIAAGTCDLFNIRLSKCGGLIPSLRLAALAHEHGLGYQLGCQIGETGILSAAGRHFACSVKNIRYLEGSYDHFLVRERLTRENLTFEWFGMAEELPGPGLGVTVEPHRLQRVMREQFPLLG